MKVLVVGGGAREHALCWKLAQSPTVSSLLCAPGNPGTATVAENLAIEAMDIESLVDVARRRSIKLAVIGPELPLSIGIADALGAAGVPVFGPDQRAARIESSKTWAKTIMARAGIPTARSVGASTLDAGLATVAAMGTPVVIKADGLAAGKGVVIAQSEVEAEAALRSFLTDRTLGDAGDTVLVEEFLQGTEISVFALCDGITSIPILPACDYKRAYAGDLGPNTGGMGAYSPVPLATPELMGKVQDEIVRPTVRAMADAGSPMVGVLFVGLMMTGDGPKVLEFNARFGDPETQVILPLLESDFGDLLLRCATGSLDDTNAAVFRSDSAAVGVVLASSGYPGDYRAGEVIYGLTTERENSIVFHAGTRFGTGNEILTAGGRVLTVVGTGPDLPSARDAAYDRAAGVTFAGVQYRPDIALREVASAPSRMRS